MMCYFYKPVKNMEAAQEIMENKSLPEEERLHYSSYLLKKAQEQQEMWKSDPANWQTIHVFATFQSWLR